MAKENKTEKRIQVLEEVQKRAHTAWLNSEGVGTLNIATGVGKTFIAFKCLYKAERLGWITKGCRVIFYAETDVRKLTLEEEAEAFKRAYNYDVMSDFDIQFVCYQANKVLEAEVKILDEIHFIGEKLAKQFENDKSFKIGLTATTSESTIVNEESFLTKEDIINAIAPVCFRYTLAQGVQDGILSPYKTTIVNNYLDNTLRYLRSGKLIMTEQAYYKSKEYLKNNKSLSEYMRRRYGMEMAKVLYILKSKIDTTTKLLKTLKGKTIIFGVEIDLLEQITPNVVSGRKSKEENQELIEKFNSGEITLIGSCKKLKQGITLEGVVNCVLVSYYSTSTDLIQQLGRVVRFAPDKVANLYIIQTVGTLEEGWVEKMTQVKNGQGKIVYNVELNLT